MYYIIIIGVKKMLNMIKNSSKTCRGFFVVAVFLIVVGIINEVYPYVGMEDIVSYISYIYFLYAFITFVCYIYSRKEKDYELILLSATSVVIGGFFYLINSDATNLILAIGIFTFGLQAVIIRLFRIVYFYKKENFLWLSKLTSTILLFLITILVSINLYIEATEVYTMLFGFYFIVYGIIYLVDLAFGAYVKSDKFKNFMHLS